jgi:3-hydroxyacyl-CoA dehydrogenase/enoyl-CoA hydratase/3-hydroxybutyryl-CoA epimerase
MVDHQNSPVRVAETSDPAAAPDGLALQVNSDGVGSLVLNCADKPVNIISNVMLDRLDAILGDVEREVAAGAVRALIVRSDKTGSFAVGAEPEDLRALADETAGAEWARRGQRIVRRLEQLAAPTVATIEGACLGAGLELALACGYRIAADQPRTAFGFPETRLGIVPAWGGTVRLPRLIGVQAAMDLILSARRIDARGAYAMGLVDELSSPGSFGDFADHFAAERAVSGRVRTGPRRAFARRLVEDTAPGRRMLLSRAARRIRKSDGSSAQQRALQAIADGVTLPLDDAFDREAEAFGELVVTPAAQNLLHVAGLTWETAAPRGLSSRARTFPAPPSVADEMKHQDAPLARPVAAAAVLGAGQRGSAIAHLLALHDVSVRVKDIEREALNAGLLRTEQLLSEQVQRRRITERDLERLRERISGALRFGGFGTADVVIEAIGENLEHKQAALREVEEHIQDDCILASTTSTCSVTRLQEVLEQPSRLAGLHFFTPVDRTPLVEVVRGDLTADGTINTLCALVRQLGKTPIVVADAPGFLLDRLLAPYLNEALKLLEEGATVGQVDGTMRDFGMLLGPLRLIDEIGTDQAQRVAKALQERLAGRLQISPLLERMLQAGRRGRSTGAGFYRYRTGKDVVPDPKILSVLQMAPSPAEGPLAAEEIRRRLTLILINEAAYALDEEIVGSAGAVDLAMLLGAGFPRFRGGLLFYADQLSAADLVQTLSSLARRYGERFAPAPLLCTLAEQDTGFYAFGQTGPVEPGASPPSGHGTEPMLR